MVCTPWVTQEQGFLTQADLAGWRESIGAHDGAVAVTTAIGDIYVIPTRNIDYTVIETRDSDDGG